MAIGEPRRSPFPAVSLGTVLFQLFVSSANANRETIMRVKLTDTAIRSYQPRAVQSAIRRWRHCLPRPMRQDHPEGDQVLRVRLPQAQGEGRVADHRPLSRPALDQSA